MEKAGNLHIEPSWLNVQVAPTDNTHTMVFILARVPVTRSLHLIFTLRAIAAAQCIVIGHVCGCWCVCGWVCYHDDSKLRASILTKLGL